MSNYLAIATVTAALQKILLAAVQTDVDGAKVTTLRPQSINSATPETGVNLYLYQTSLNQVWKNSADVRARNRKGETAKRSLTALDLHYMLSFYGNEGELEPQRLLGSVIRTLSDRQHLTKDMIQETIFDANFHYLANSNLGEQIEEISFSLQDLSLEDLSKVWSVFFQTPYALSVAYKATAVIVEGEEPAKKALPVRSRAWSVGPFSAQPTVSQVVCAAGALEPLVANSILLVRGYNLKNEQTLVRVGQVEVIPQEVSEKEIVLPLSLVPINSLRAGVQSLQVIHRLQTNTRGDFRFLDVASKDIDQLAPTQNVESNAAAFVLRPTVIKASVSNLQGREEEVRSAEIKLRVDVSIGKQQRVLLAMNQKSANNPAAYLFEAPQRRTDTSLIVVPVQNVKPGEYLLRLQVDGAESQLTIDTDPNSRTFNQYNSPKVVIR
ncbi:DUF4255 domain-containing protein [Ancylothrix sp. C2]|uniref:DUF4255 domain-containing protein n=1 Tax=Ancylothrix sp. D3o TaxID=2953691 RepID=UPI0021BB28E2|nr:DUF4255 domain-containing protein [Ancylothrix sp. D3o]MCT7948242.1 DUF4255 domain-containing protein [Ancylothrix sp. D3o]